MLSPGNPAPRQRVHFEDDMSQVSSPQGKSFSSASNLFTKQKMRPLKLSPSVAAASPLLTDEDNKDGRTSAVAELNPDGIVQLRDPVGSRVTLVNMD